MKKKYLVAVSAALLAVAPIASLSTNAGQSQVVYAKKKNFYDSSNKKYLKKDATLRRYNKLMEDATDKEKGNLTAVRTAKVYRAKYSNGYKTMHLKATGRKIKSGYDLVDSPSSVLRINGTYYYEMTYHNRDNYVRCKDFRYDPYTNSASYQAALKNIKDSAENYREAEDLPLPVIAKKTTKIYDRSYMPGTTSAKNVNKHAKTLKAGKETDIDNLEATLIKYHGAYYIADNDVAIRYSDVEIQKYDASHQEAIG